MAKGFTVKTVAPKKKEPEWDIDAMDTVVLSGDFIHNLGELPIGKTYEYIDYSGRVFFKKLPQ